MVNRKQVKPLSQLPGRPLVQRVAWWIGLAVVLMVSVVISFLMYILFCFMILPDASLLRAQGKLKVKGTILSQSDGELIITKAACNGLECHLNFYGKVKFVATDESQKYRVGEEVIVHVGEQQRADQPMTYQRAPGVKDYSIYTLKSIEPSRDNSFEFERLTLAGLGLLPFMTAFTLFIGYKYIKAERPPL
jgi:hypothetical protein